MSEFYKSQRDCKNFEFKVSKRSDIERVLKYFKNKEYQPLPKDLLVTAK